MPTPFPTEAMQRKAAATGRNVLSGVLLGVGIAAFLDEAIFHQLLHWHHFYDRSTPAIGLISDGLFRAFSWFATIAGLFLFADLRRRMVLNALQWWGGLLIGTGGFQRYDGTVQHKIMRLHQIRYHVDMTPGPHTFCWCHPDVWSAPINAFAHHLADATNTLPAQEGARDI